MRSCWIPVYETQNKEHKLQKMNLLQTNWESRRFEHRFYAEIVADITTNDVI